MQFNRLFWQDLLLILTMAVLAGCGLIYEYLLSHYAGRVLGVMESAIYSMIGLMIVSMGLGAFAARKIKCAFNGFVWLELTVALIGTTAILMISGIVAFTQLLPQIIADTYAIPPDATPRGGLFKQLTWLALKTPYFFGFILGFLIGMEIPLIAKIREHIHQKHLENNLGTIYGADYIGAGIGAAIWVTFLLTIDISKASALTAALNLLAGAVFIFVYWSKLKYRLTLVSGHILLLIGLVLIYFNGNQWLNQMSNLLYLDKVVHSEKTVYQQVTITERRLGNEQPSIFNLYLNGRLQFSSADEHIYHSYLVAPTLEGSARQENILIIGGGDGLALRDVLTWHPKQVTLVDLDKALVDLFKAPKETLEPGLARRITELNHNSLSHPNVNLLHGDAFIVIDELLRQGKVYDSIIVDLPDPSHPDLNKLYSVNFYARLKQLLSGDGLISVQSTSPYHAKNAFISIGKTMKAAGFLHVEQYHDNVPSFGEWGWTIAAKAGLSARQRLSQKHQFSRPQTWLTLPMLLGSFEFAEGFYQQISEIPINYLGSHAIYQLHQQAWQDQQGIHSAFMHQEQNKN
ncbi:polyamine aminopropyltransferase [Thalassotalea marina]|uniref:Polyamine aminopropyltransferase n=1 Tax=Thalassotalea marina TaxID=1673741 RepID=A0A919BFD6_9GAMM|nr:polyamine aminopropyltransferase [Thalassotalea marina]GHF85189.1 polyamine aminopropyltransferase [Thalassotalea marina]